MKIFRYPMMEDHLSQLPADLQRQIMSLLPWKEAVRTSTASKLWRRIWFSSPRLQLKFASFPDSGNSLLRFRQAVDQVLAHHDESAVDTFDLYLCITELDPYFAEPVELKTLDNAWIEFAVAHRVRNLKLYGQVRNFPANLFTCRSIVKLDLALQSLVFELPANAHLPNLKNFDLRMVTLTNRSFYRDISLCFPLLEELSLEYCKMMDPMVLAIRSRKLEVFSMHDCENVENCEVQLDAPALTDFSIFGGVAKDYVLNAPAVTEVCTNLGDHELEDNNEALSRVLIRVLEKLSGTISLRLNDIAIEVLSHARDLWSLYRTSYRNVLKLSLDLFPTLRHVEMTAFILGKCPNVFSLEIIMEEVEDEDPEILASELDLGNVGFVLSTLSRVQIYDFRAKENELLLVKLLLTVSPALSHPKIIKRSRFGETTEINLPPDCRDEDYSNACSGDFVILSLSDA